MKRTKRAVWQERVRGWKQSGLTAETFAVRENLKAGTLRHWSWLLGHERRVKHGPKRGEIARADFVELISPQVVESVRAPRPRAFDVTLPNGARIVVPAHFDAAVLATLCRVVGGE